MAEELYISYSLNCGKKDHQYYGRDDFTATITRLETPPSNAVVKSADLRFTDICVGSTNKPYLKFGSLFTTAGLESGNGFQKVAVTKWDSNILDVESDTVTVEIKNLADNLKAFDFDSTVATLNVYYRISSSNSNSSLSSSSVDAGETMKVTFNNTNISNVYHTVDWVIGSFSHRVTTGYGDTSASHTIPYEWLEAIPNSVSGTGTVVVKTYSSSGLLGTSSKTFTQNVPESVVPTFSSLASTRVDNSVPADWGIYIQNQSGVHLTVNGAKGVYGSSITRYNFSGGTASTIATNIFTVPLIPESGNIVFTATVTDSRGRTSSPKSISINVEPYSFPTFTYAQAYRCSSTGTPSEEGTYIGARADYTYSTLGSKNSAVLKVYYQKIGEETWTLGNGGFSPNTNVFFGGGGVGVEYSYRVKFVVEDRLMITERISNVSTASYSMFFRKGGTGVAFGKICERDFSVEFNPDWTVWYGDYRMLPIHYGSEPSNPVEGLIWLEPVD